MTMRTTRPLACTVGMLAAALLAGCGGTTDRLLIDTLDKSGHSAIAVARTTVVQDGVSWSALWTEHTANRTPPPGLPSVDFSRESVVAVFLGTRPNACYSVHIQSVQQALHQVLVFYSEQTPAPDALCAQVVTTPAHIVRIQKSGSPFQFIKVN